MATLTQDELLEAIDKMTVLELSEFIKRSRSATASPPRPRSRLPPRRAAGGGAAGRGRGRRGADRVLARS